jgi:glycerol-3-phosphate dehydrogenase
MPDLKFSATFYDAWISHPERLGIELLSDVASESSNCVALNYAELVPTDDGLSLRCKRDGAELPIEASVIVNATGAWLDDTIGHLQGNNVQERLVSGTKGSHLILDNAELEAALNGHMAYFENADGRVCIVFPYLGKVLAGSTDIRVDAARRVRCEPEEEAYILESLRLVFPDIELSPSDVVFSFAGIRPLPKSDHDFTGRISRGHYIKRLEGKILQFCMIGGKWTTFRAFAEQTADIVLKELGKDRKVDTGTIPIGGGRDFPSDISELVTQLVLEFGINHERAERMTKSYGTEASNILAFCKTLPADHPLSQTCSLTTGEILYFLRQEHVETISDLILRRTTLAISGTLSLQDLDQIIRLILIEKGLSENRALELRAEALHELNEFYGVTQQMLESRNKEMELINAS